MNLFLYCFFLIPKLRNLIIIFTNQLALIYSANSGVGGPEIEITLPPFFKYLKIFPVFYYLDCSKPHHNIEEFAQNFEF
jgi:hypothetical protein